MRRKKTKKIPTVFEIEKAIKIPAAKWKGNCYSIACAIVEAGLVGGVAVYGHWIGPIASSSMFAAKTAIGFCQHGWILLDDGRILDPTRWVFEDVAPYIYTGFEPDDDPGRAAWPYDEGGNKLRAAFGRPAPKPEGERKRSLAPLSENARIYVEELLNDRNIDAITDGQLLWLANLPYQSLGSFVGEVYDLIVHEDKIAFIPYDNQKRAERERAERERAQKRRS